MNGYTTIDLNGTPVGLKFAYPAIKLFTEACVKNTDIYFIGEGDAGGFTVEGLAKLIECSYRNNCILKEVEPALKFEDFYNYVEQAQETPEGLEELKKVSEVYADSTVMKKLIASNKELEKKRQTSQ